MTLQELERLIVKNRNIKLNTAKSTETWVKAFERWRMTGQIGQELEEVPKERLNGVYTAGLLCGSPQKRWKHRTAHIDTKLELMDCVRLDVK